MLVTAEQINKGINLFIEKDLIQTRRISRNTIFFVMPMLQTWINQKMADYRNKPVYQQIVTGDRIDVDRLHELGNRAMEPSGQIRLMNMTFTKADVDQLYRRILEAV